MNCNTQNAKIAPITEKTLIVGIDVGSVTHYARAFDWRNYEYSISISNTNCSKKSIMILCVKVRAGERKIAEMAGSCTV